MRIYYILIMNYNEMTMQLLLTRQKNQHELDNLKQMYEARLNQIYSKKPISGKQISK
jgi:hypothetical protein